MILCRLTLLSVRLQSDGWNRFRWKGWDGLICAPVRLSGAMLSPTHLSRLHYEPRKTHECYSLQWLKIDRNSSQTTHIPSGHRSRVCAKSHLLQAPPPPSQARRQLALCPRLVPVLPPFNKQRKLCLLNSFRCDVSHTCDKRASVCARSSWSCGKPQRNYSLPAALIGSHEQVEPLMTAPARQKSRKMHCCVAKKQQLPKRCAEGSSETQLYL